MLDERHLTYGLNALGRAHETDYFVNGHRGAAIIAAYFLSREIEMEEGAADTVQDMIDAQWAHLPLCAPFPDERADPSLVARIVASVSTTTQGLRQAGHNVIFPALALKAFRDVPDALTPSRVEGICKLVEAFTVADELKLDEGAPCRTLGQGHTPLNSSWPSFSSAWPPSMGADRDGRATYSRSGEPCSISASWATGIWLAMQSRPSQSM